jgi:hypothetical protein
MFRVIFTRIFQNDMLNANVVISNMAQIHQNTTLQKEAKTSCLLCFTSRQQQQQQQQQRMCR